MNIIKTIAWIVFAVAVGLTLLELGLVALDPVQRWDMGDALGYSLFEALIIGIPYGIYWYWLSRASPKMNEPILIVVVVALLAGVSQYLAFSGLIAWQQSMISFVNILIGDIVFAGVLSIGLRHISHEKEE